MKDPLPRVKGPYQPSYAETMTQLASRAVTLGALAAVVVSVASHVVSELTEWDLAQQRINELNSLIASACQIEGKDTSLAGNVEYQCETKLIESFQSILDAKGNEFIVSDRDRFGRGIDNNHPEGEKNYDIIRERLDTVVPEVVQETYEEAVERQAKMEQLAQAGEIAKSVLKDAAADFTAPDSKLWQNVEYLDVNIRGIHADAGPSGENPRLALSFQADIKERPDNGSGAQYSIIYDNKTDMGGQSSFVEQVTAQNSGKTLSKGANDIAGTDNSNPWVSLTFHRNASVPDKLAYDHCAIQTESLACALADHVNQKLGQLSQEEQQVLLERQGHYQDLSAMEWTHDTVPTRHLNSYEFAK